jgi:hypothetical protein
MQGMNTDISGRCPHCDGSLAVHAPVPEQPLPEPGTPTVCGHCGFILVFSEGLSLRVAAQAELEFWKTADPEMFEWLMATRALFTQTAKHRRG